MQTQERSLGSISGTNIGIGTQLMTTQQVVTNPAIAQNNAQVSSVQVKRGPITVDMVRASLKRNPDGSPNRDTAQLRQETTRLYPSGKVGNSLQDTLFDQADFNFQTREAKSIRMAFIDVPLGKTREQVEAMLKQFPNSCIYQILSDEPILSDTQEQAIAAGLLSMDDIAFGRPDEETGKRVGGQVVRYGKSTNIPEGKGPQDMVPGPSGGLQFRNTFYSKEFKADIDNRRRVPSQGSTSFSSKEASHLTRSLMTRDQLEHEGKVTSTGKNPSAAEMREQGKDVNDFKGHISQGEQNAGNYPSTVPVSAMAGFAGQTPDIISEVEQDALNRPADYPGNDSGTGNPNDPGSLANTNATGATYDPNTDITTYPDEQIQAPSTSEENRDLHNQAPTQE